VQAILSHRQQLQPCVNEGEVFYDAEVGYLEPGDDEETSYGDLAAYRPVASSQPPSAFSSQQYGVQQVVSQQNSNQQVTLQQESTSTGNTPPALGPPLLPMTVTQQLPTIITEADAQAGRAVYPVSAPVIVQTTEGLYTMTGGQVYWNGHNRAQRLQNVCSNNRGIGCSTPKGRNEHIRKAHSVFNQPNAGDRKYSKVNLMDVKLTFCRDQSVLRGTLGLEAKDCSGEDAHEGDAVETNRCKCMKKWD
jgi:hypothetical protein